jgi:hypothetical protein
VHQQPLGFDSCGIFYIGGNVQVSLPWSLENIVELTAFADHLESSTLDVYNGQNHSGQHWAAYRSKKLKERDDEKCLKERLEDLLAPSTAVAELQAIPKREGTLYCPYLRIKQKAMDRKEWLVNDVIRNGAHFPLCVFTNNSRARSADKARERAQKAKGRINGGKGKTKGTAGKSKSKGGTPAVAEDASTTKGQSANPQSWNHSPVWSAASSSNAWGQRGNPQSWNDPSSASTSNT